VVGRRFRAVLKSSSLQRHYGGMALLMALQTCHNVAAAAERKRWWRIVLTPRFDNLPLGMCCRTRGERFAWRGRGQRTGCDATASGGRQNRKGVVVSYVVAEEDAPRPSVCFRPWRAGLPVPAAFTTLRHLPGGCCCCARRPYPHHAALWRASALAFVRFPAFAPRVIPFSPAFPCWSCDCRWAPAWRTGGGSQTLFGSGFFAERFSSVFGFLRCPLFIRHQHAGTGWHYRGEETPSENHSTVLTKICLCGILRAGWALCFIAMTFMFTLISSGAAQRTGWCRTLFLLDQDNAAGISVRSRWDVGRAGRHSLSHTRHLLPLPSCAISERLAWLYQHLFLTHFSLILALYSPWTSGAAFPDMPSLAAGTTFSAVPSAFHLPVLVRSHLLRYCVTFYTAVLFGRYVQNYTLYYLPAVRAHAGVVSRAADGFSPRGYLFLHSHFTGADVPWLAGVAIPSLRLLLLHPIPFLLRMFFLSATNHSLRLDFCSRAVCFYHHLQQVTSSLVSLLRLHSIAGGVGSPSGCMVAYPLAQAAPFTHARLCPIACRGEPAHRAPYSPLAGISLSCFTPACPSPAVIPHHSLAAADDVPAGHAHYAATRAGGIPLHACNAALVG